jgi:glutamate synthase (NADH)
MLLIDTANRVIIGDDEIKMSIARSRPHSDWLNQLVTLDDIRKASPVICNQDGEAPSIEPQLKSAEDIRKQLSLFNYTLETLSLLLVPMFANK